MFQCPHANCKLSLLVKGALLTIHFYLGGNNSDSVLVDFKNIFLHKRRVVFRLLQATRQMPVKFQSVTIIITPNLAASRLGEKAFYPLVNGSPVFVYPRSAWRQMGDKFLINSMIINSMASNAENVSIWWRHHIVVWVFLRIRYISPYNAIYLKKIICKTVCFPDINWH